MVLILAAQQGCSSTRMSPAAAVKVVADVRGSWAFYGILWLHLLKKLAAQALYCVVSGPFLVEATIGADTRSRNSRVWHGVKETSARIHTAHGFCTAANRMSNLCCIAYRFCCTTPLVCLIKTCMQVCRAERAM